MLVREAIQQNKKFKDFEIIIIKIVSQESRAYRQILKNQALSMQKLFDDNKDTIINLNFFCKQFQTLCQDIYIVASKDSGSILNYQTNDLFYTILKLGYDNFASITNRVWFTNDVGMAIGSFCQLLSYIHSRDDMLAFFPNNQQLNIKFWLQEVERYLFLQYMNTKTTNINNTIFIL
jgi:hypothetical protein